MSTIDFERHRSADEVADRLLLKAAKKTLRRTRRAQDRLPLLALVGSLQRALGDDRRAARKLARALRLSQKLGNAEAEAANHVRYGTALQFLNRHEEALGHFNHVIVSDDPAHIAHQHYAYQHKGKCLAELQDFDAARVALERALELRQLLGDDALIESTQLALNALDEIDSTPSA